MNYQQELLNLSKKKYDVPPAVQAAYLALPRHEFVNRFSVDYENWLEVNESTLPLIYGDTTLLLYKKDKFVSTISQPSFVLRMLELLDLKPGQKVFELGGGCGWNAALIGHLVGPKGTVKSFEIIPEMAREAQQNLQQFNLPQVEILQGDALTGAWDLDDYDRGVFTAGLWDLPGIFFDVMREGGKFLFVLKTTDGDILLCLEREHDHFRVFDTIFCTFVAVTGETSQNYFNDLSEVYNHKGQIRIYPQGTINLEGRIIPGKDMLFQLM